jgi:hypothetical protein
MTTPGQKLYLQQRPSQYHSEFYPKQTNLEELVYKTQEILKKYGIEYVFSDIDVKFDFHFQKRQINYTLEIYSNLGPYAKPDIAEPFVIVKLVYGNNRSTQDYTLMDMIQRAIQDDENFSDEYMRKLIEDLSN